MKFVPGVFMVFFLISVGFQFAGYGPTVYKPIGSMATVLWLWWAFVSVRSWWIAVLALGCAANTAVIIMNGWSMPVLMFNGVTPITESLTHHALNEGSRLPFLADWIWGASPGDILIFVSIPFVFLKGLRSKAW